MHHAQVATPVVRARGVFAGTHGRAEAGRVQTRRRVFEAEATLARSDALASAFPLAVTIERFAPNLMQTPCFTLLQGGTDEEKSPYQLYAR
jgi:hypothetical protein